MNNDIENKMSSFIKEFDENNNVNHTIEIFKEIFKNGYIEKGSGTNEAYYKIYTKNYYIKNSNGICLSVTTGPGDIFGDKHSHEGTDVILYSKLSKDYDCKNGIVLFSESEKNNVNISEKLKLLFDVDLSLKSLEENTDNMIYKTLSDDISKSDEVVLKRYSDMKFEAEMRFEDEVEYDMISPYGGLDVEFHYVNDSLYKEIKEFADDEYFYKKALSLFSKDFPQYFDDGIEECNKAISVIDNKDKYYELAQLESDYYVYRDMYEYLDELSEKRDAKQLELNNLLDKMKTLNEKKFNIFDLINGKKKQHLKHIDLISKKINYIQSKLKEINLKYDNLMVDIQEDKKREMKVKDLKEELPYNINDFNLSEEWDNVFINGVYYEIVLLDRLMNKENFYRERLKEFESMKEMINNPEYSIDIEENNEMEYSYNI